ETGMILIPPLPGVTTTKPGSATFPFPGVSADVVDGEGASVPLGGGGYLVLKRPWPAMLRGIYGDPERYRETYWSRFPGMYFAGDGAKRDLEGYFWLLGRVDDVMNGAGRWATRRRSPTAAWWTPFGRTPARPRRTEGAVRVPPEVAGAQTSRAGGRPTVRAGHPVRGTDRRVATGRDHGHPRSPVGRP